MIDTIERTVLAKISLSKQKQLELKKVVSQLVVDTNKIVRNCKLNATPLIVGSVAKNTYLNDVDVDLFIKFPTVYKKEDLGKLVLSIGKKILKNCTQRYAEHPYVHGNYKNYSVEIVPCYDVKAPTEKLSAVDRTPFHTEYVIKNLKKKQSDEVKLLKQFLRGAGIYGAEAAVQGFSGYLCELLILNYKTFKNTLKAAQRWQIGQRLELGGKSKVDFTEPLIVVDPVDPARNAAAAVSLENFCKFVHAAQEYLKKPSLEFFFPPETKLLSRQAILDLLSKRGTKLLIVKFAKPAVVDDVLYPQIRKSLKVFSNLFEKFEFKLLQSNFFVTNKSVLLIFELEVYKLPAVKLHLGPPCTDKRNAIRFIQRWQKRKHKFTQPYIKGDKWVVEIYRRYSTPEELVRGKISTLNLGKDIKKSVQKKYNLITNDACVKTEYLKALTNFFVKKFSRL